LERQRRQGSDLAHVGVVVVEIAFLVHIGLDVRVVLVEATTESDRQQSAEQRALTRRPTKGPEVHALPPWQFGARCIPSQSRRHSLARRFRLLAPPPRRSRGACRWAGTSRAMPTSVD